MIVQLTVFGTPAAAGSKRPFRVKSGGEYTGQVVITDANKRAKPWKNLIAQQAGEFMQDKELLRCPIAMRLTFYVKRPKGHIGKRGLLPSAPDYPAVKPDVLKLARAVEDALSGIIYGDDALIVSEQLNKRYGEPERVEIQVAPMITPLLQSLL